MFVIHLHRNQCHTKFSVSRGRYCESLIHTRRIPFGVTPGLSPAAVSKSGSGTTSKPASLRARAASRGTGKPPPKPRAAPSSSSTGQRKLPSSSAKGNASHSQHHMAIPAIRTLQSYFRRVCLDACMARAVVFFTSEGVDPFGFPGPGCVETEAA